MTRLSDEEIEFYDELNQIIPMPLTKSRSTLEVNSSNEVLAPEQLYFSDREGLRKVLYTIDYNNCKILKELSFPAMTEVDHVDRSITTNGRAVFDFLGNYGISVNKFIVDVSVPISQNVNITQINGYSITSNGNNQVIPIPNGYDAVDAVSVNVNVPLPSIGQISNYNLTSNGTGINIPLPANKDAVDSISVDVNVPTSSVNLQSSASYNVQKVYTSYPDVLSITVLPDQGYDAIERVNIGVSTIVRDNKTITANGSYDPSSEGLDCYGTITVNVPTGHTPKLTNISLSSDSSIGSVVDIVNDTWNKANSTNTITVPAGRTVIVLRYSAYGLVIRVFGIKAGGNSSSYSVNRGDYYIQLNYDIGAYVYLWDLTASYIDKYILQMSTVNLNTNNTNNYEYMSNIVLNYMFIDYPLEGELTYVTV